MSENTAQRTYRIAVIPGDGIGKEIVPHAQAALEKATEGLAEFVYEDFDLGAERYLRDGSILPDEDLERIKQQDAILLGAVGDPRVKPGVLERGLLLKLRFALDQYVNLRPSKLYKGVTSLWRIREASISWWCGKAPKVCMWVQAVPYVAGLPGGGHRGFTEYRLRGRTRHPLRLRAGDEAPQAHHLGA